ncbi:hypothetical protein [Aquibacillus sediminis]|uniref:hypothetical protein n=1 Tax=Aquibacillus sediminis TaxID=2574734 RepID=UPI0011081CD1|nr:hypothetical protein [Aquibacillus sediminis]
MNKLTELHKLRIGSLVFIGLTVTILQLVILYTGGSLISTMISLILIVIALTIIILLFKSMDVKKYLEEMKQR